MKVTVVVLQRGSASRLLLSENASLDECVHSLKSLSLFRHSSRESIVKDKKKKISSHY